MSGSEATLILLQTASNALILCQNPGNLRGFAPSKNGSTAAVKMNDVRNPTLKGHNIPERHFNRALFQSTHKVLSARQFRQYF
jgi:hypothetical protein